MDYGNDSRYEEYEEAPESLLHQQRRRLPAGRKLLLILLAGGGAAIFLILLISFYTGGTDQRQAQTSRKSINLGSAEQLPKADDSSGNLRLQATLADLQSRVTANHDQLMGGVQQVHEQLDEQGLVLDSLVRQVEALSDRAEKLEKEIQAAEQAVKEAAAAAETSEPAPKSEPEPELEPESAKKKQYTVKDDDTLYSIARQHDIELKILLEINGLTEDSVIHPGDKLTVSP
ncbi:MAG: LysM domain-containing protein [Desulfosalsimonas sp.]|uniref:LysM peptidoglycan-binding domain-containing protein n=1 Tax=Desulfosalsimonas sp. TaxID=3073848 RepID=UPI003970AC97